MRLFPSTFELRKRTLLVRPVLRVHGSRLAGFHRRRRDWLRRQLARGYCSVSFERSRRKKWRRARDGWGREARDGVRGGPCGIMGCPPLTASSHRFANLVPLNRQHCHTATGPDPLTEGHRPRVVAKDDNVEEGKLGLGVSSARSDQWGRRLMPVSRLTRSTASSIGSLHSCAIFSMTPDVATLVAIMSSDP